MCVILACVERRPSEEVLRKCHSENPHGIGFSWVESGAVKWEKAMRLPDLLDEVQIADLPYVIHFRYASVGGVMKSLAHPFPIEKVPRIDLEGEAEQVLFHNGTVHYWKAIASAANIPRLGQPCSDSRAIAAIAHKRGSKILKKLGGNRFAVLSKDRTVHLIGKWINRNGIYYSNEDWKSPRRPAAKSVNGRVPISYVQRGDKMVPTLGYEAHKVDNRWEWSSANNTTRDQLDLITDPVKTTNQETSQEK